MEKVKAPVLARCSPMIGGQPHVPPPPGPMWTPPPLAPPSAAAASTPLLGGLTAPRSEVEPDVPTDPAAVLDRLVATIGDVRSALLASIDGFGLARSCSMNDEPAHPAMLAAAMGLAHQLVAMGGGDRLRQLVVEHDAGLLLLWPLADERVLAVLASHTVDQGQIRSFVGAHVTALAGVTR